MASAPRAVTPQAPTRPTRRPRRSSTKCFSRRTRRSARRHLGRRTVTLSRRRRHPASALLAAPTSHRVRLRVGARPPRASRWLWTPLSSSTWTRRGCGSGMSSCGRLSVRRAHPTTSPTSSRSRSASASASSRVRTVPPRIGRACADNASADRTSRACAAGRRASRDDEVAQLASGLQRGAQGVPTWCVAIAFVHRTGLRSHSETRRRSARRKESAKEEGAAQLPYDTGLMQRVRPTDFQ
mmetsp:Transcript_36157/g.95284  ORF Transcript_36157/g.95284 Transcript_36157/m.95284 type:complete len:240 (-) Transcript_36157:203-922(-)